MKIRSLTVFALVLGCMSLSLKAESDLNVVRVDDDNTKVGLNFDNGAGADIFGLNLGLYGKSKKNGCDCSAMQNALDNTTSNRKQTSLKKRIQNCNCPQATPQRGQKNTRRIQNQNNQ